jgi:hypothetical protein
LVTVLTPATTFTVGEDCNQNSRAVNRTSALIYNFYEKSLRRGVEKETCRETGFRALTKREAEPTGQSSQLFPVATGRNAQFLPASERSGLVRQVAIDLTVPNQLGMKNQGRKEYERPFFGSPQVRAGNTEN